MGKSIKSKSSITSRVDSASRVSRHDSRRDTKDAFKDAKDCWPTDNSKFIDRRECHKGQKYHDKGGYCYEIDGHIENQCHHLYSKTALSHRFYRIVNTEGESISTIWEMSPLLHQFGSIDILQQKMKANDKKTLSTFVILKRNQEVVKKELEKERKKNQKKINKQIGIHPDQRRILLRKNIDETKLPQNFSDWPMVFTLISNKDNSKLSKKKKKDLRDCLNRRITFMRDCVYDCGKIESSWISKHLDFILKLQIMAIQSEA